MANWILGFVAVVCAVAVADFKKQFKIQKTKSTAGRSKQSKLASDQALNG